VLNNIKIGTKLLVICGLLIVVPLIVVAVISVTQSGRGLTKVEDQELHTRAQQIASTINNVVAEEQKMVLVLSEQSNVVDAANLVYTHDTANSASIISRVTRDFVSIDNSKSVGAATEGVYSAGADGTVFAASDSNLVGSSIAAKKYFQEALKGSVSVGTIETTTSKVPYVPVAAPIRRPGTDKVIGVLVNDLGAAFADRLVSKIKIGTTGYAFILDERGVVIGFPDKSKLFVTNFLTSPGISNLAKLMVGGKNGVDDYTFSGQDMTGGYAPVKLTGWSVSLTLPISEYMATVNDIRNIAVLVTAIALAFAVLILVFFVRSITKPLSQAVDYAKLVADGDFTRQLNIHRKDEIGALTGALNDMVERLKEMIIQIRDASLHVAGSSEEISASAEQLAAGTQSQASTLEETSASVEELTASVEQVSDHAQSQAASVEESTSNMRQMQNSVEQVSKTLANVSSSSQESMSKAESGVDAVKEAVDAINNISKGSEQIAGIINVISDIADQTNLLALNASIEAARAGEHGRGFAVVADEVSKLADRSSSSTKEIEKLIKESMKDVNSGVEIAQAALTSMNEIISGARSTNEMVGALSADIEQQISGIREQTKATESISEMSQSISAATEEQTANAKQVAKAIENVNELTQQAAGAAEEMSATTEELSALAQQMQRIVELFKLNETASSHEPSSPRAQKQTTGQGAESPVAANGHNGYGAVNGNGHNGVESGDESLNGAEHTLSLSEMELNGGADEDTRIALKKRTNGHAVHS
jgi:methyl-accepting chemotaxis protein